MVEQYTGRARRRFPSPEMLQSAAALFPGQHPGVRASCTWLTTEDNNPLWDDATDVQLHQADALTEGPQWYVSMSPGRVRVWTRDEARADRTDNRARDMRAKAADALATFAEVDDDGVLIALEEPERIPTREVTSWSAKSRSNMIGSYADLDFTPMFTDIDRIAAMLTFTYPRCWGVVAPNGKTVKRHMKAWRKRFERTFGKIQCIWKLEFQQRHQWVYRDGERVYNWCTCETCAKDEDGRAPHIHMFTTIPTWRYVHDARGKLVPVVDAVGKPVFGEYLTERVTMEDFKTWLSTSWAAVVDHPDPVEYAAHVGAGTRVDTTEGGRAADPRRLVTYFAKHGGASAKEYQHIVPVRWHAPGEGPGRFWGYWGLEKAVVTVPVEPAVGAEAGRILRRHSRAQGVTRLTSRRRYKGGRVDSAYGEVIGLAGKLLVEAHQEYRRPCRTRAVRAVNGRGWTVVNDGSMFAGHLGRALTAAIKHREEQLVLELDPRAPLARAWRLPAGPRRDALLAKLQTRVQ
ncbi:hypothetical protein [Amycolatopsis sp. lyj-84]|uniref:hypothetical protein n=1 Tax=Amycolatopsis sp. lyj-84 TaxID=2789284 RepID=UPI00397D5200